MENCVYELEQEFAVNHWWVQGRSRIIQSILTAIIEPSQHPFILDIGCGSGVMTALLTSQQFRCVGLDTNPEAIRTAQQLFPDNQFINGDIGTVFEALKETPSVFLLLDVLEHIEDDKTFLKKILSQMPPSSHLLITVPAMKALWSQHDVTAHHYRRYEFTEFVELWENDPTVHVRLLSFFNSRLYPLIKCVRTVTQKLNRSFGSKGTDYSKTPPFLNAVLTRFFAGEGKSLLKSLDQSQRYMPYQKGVSLVALLQKKV